MQSPKPHEKRYFEVMFFKDFRFGIPIWKS